MTWAVQVFSVLVMRTASSGWSRSGYPASDLTARARILDAAVTVFAEQGASASIRAIAAAASVSPALITHHFGTKEALKAECDQRVLDAYTQVKMAGIADPLSAMSIVDDSDQEQSERIAMLGTYMMRAFLDGGQTARSFHQNLIERISDVMTAAVASGMVRPECADDAHVRYLAASMLGFMVVQFVIDPPSNQLGFFQNMTTSPSMVEAMIDVYTNPVFTSDQILAGYRAATNKEEKKEENV